MIKGTAENIKQYFQRRAIAYCRVFEKQSPFVHDVLMDLAKFCKANESAFNKDPIAMAYMQGRRDVFLRIQENLQLTADELFKLHVAKSGE